MEEFEFLAIPELKSRGEQKRSKLVNYQTTRLVVDVDSNLLEQVKDYAYWNGFTQQQIIMRALEAFFKDKEVNPRPEAVRNRPRVGRKPK